MLENHFLRGERKPTPTDVKLAECYYPLLVEVQKSGNVITFKDFVALAKDRYPDVEEVQNAIPVSTGRRFEFIRIYTIEKQLPDLSAWVVGQSGTNSPTYQADFDPEEQREATKNINWDDYKGEWNEYVQTLSQLSVKVRRRKPADAIKLMGQHFATIKDRIPNPKNLPLLEITKHFRASVLEGLMEGKDVDDVFNDVVFDMTESISAGETH